MAAFLAGDRGVGAGRDAGATDGTRLAGRLRRYRHLGVPL